MSRRLNFSNGRPIEWWDQQTLQELKHTKDCLSAVCADCDRYNVYAGKEGWWCPNCEYWRALLEVLQKIKEW